MQSPTQGQRIIGSAVTGAIAGYFLGSVKVGTVLGAAYGWWYGQASEAKRQRAPVPLDRLVRMMQDRLEAAGIDPGSVSVAQDKVVVTLPTIQAATARGVLRDIPSSRIVQDQTGERMAIHFDIPRGVRRTVDAPPATGEYGGPAFYVPGAGSGSQAGMWSYERPGV